MVDIEQGQYQAADHWVQQPLVVNASLPYFQNNRGLYQLYLGNLEEGLEDINLSLKQNSRNLYALRNKGIYYAMTHDNELALKYLQDVQDRDPDIPLVKDYLEKIMRAD